MKKNLKQYLFPSLGFLLSLLTALFWVALRINHSGISKFLGADHNQSFLIMNLPVLVCVAAWVACAISLAGLLLWNRRRWPAILGFTLGVIFAIGAVVVIFFGARDYMRFILPHFWRSVAVAVAIIVFALVLYFPIRGKRLAKALLLAAVIVFAVVAGYQLRPCTLTYGAVVYAVEDTYQIVFSTSDSAIAWVEIGGECYYDLYAGSMRSADRVHKVEVPQSVLDEAKGYVICAKQMIYRGPFGGYTGETLTETYTFRPVDVSDGLDYFALSDVHEAVDAAALAAQGENDFIILLGDIVSMVETEEDAQLANVLAHNITGGEIPVIYVRGNHEIKGEYAEVLYKYVGSRNQEYYYTVTLGDLFAVVLDIGEDHEDDWWEYYGTAQFDRYRAAQSRMLEEILKAGDYENYTYRLALTHVSPVYVDGLFEAFRREWTTLLNEMDIDLCLSGHEHELWAFIPGRLTPGEAMSYRDRTVYQTDIQFPGILAGRRSLAQTGSTQKNGYDQYTGLRVHADFASGTHTAFYRNSLGETLACVYPFEEETFQELILPLGKERLATTGAVE